MVQLIRNGQRNVTNQVLQSAARFMNNNFKSRISYINNYINVRNCSIVNRMEWLAN